MREAYLFTCSRYSLKFTPCSLLVVKSLVTRCKIHSLLVAEVAFCKKLLATRCKKSLVTRYEKDPRINVHLKPIKLGEFYLFILYFQLTKTEKDSVHNKISIAKIYCDIVQFNYIFQVNYLQ